MSSVLILQTADLLAEFQEITRHRISSEDAFRLFDRLLYVLDTQHIDDIKPSELFDYSELSFANHLTFDPTRFSYLGMGILREFYQRLKRLALFENGELLCIAYRMHAMDLCVRRCNPR